MAVDPDFWAGKTVLITGHTGFKGGWLACWLSNMGARVAGYALDPPTDPSFYEAVGIGDFLWRDVRGDILDRAALNSAFSEIEPEIVFHMAAQSLVCDGYADPLGTYETNVLGTGNVLMSAFTSPCVKTVISVASDKCYENNSSEHPFRETDRLGGTDPYSGSKGCAEILTASLAASVPRTARVASVRAGNVIGGGDWAKDRLVPDCIRAFADGVPVEIRRPDAIRPWQFVLEPLAGYLALAEALTSADDASLEGGWNFGPETGDEWAVLQVAQKLAAAWGEGARLHVNPESAEFAEARVLRLDSTKACTHLNWRPELSMDETMDWTAKWYLAWKHSGNLAEITTEQIASYAGRL